MLAALVLSLRLVRELVSLFEFVTGSLIVAEKAVCLL